MIFHIENAFYLLNIFFHSFYQVKRYSLVYGQMVLWVLDFNIII